MFWLQENLILMKCRNKRYFGPSFVRTMDRAAWWKNKRFGHYNSDSIIEWFKIVDFQVQWKMHDTFQVSCWTELQLLLGSFTISCHFLAKCRFFIQKINKQDSWFFRFWSLTEKQKMEWTGHLSSHRKWYWLFPK